MEQGASRVEVIKKADVNSAFFNAGLAWATTQAQID